MKIFQISSEVNSGSVGRIAEQIGERVIEQGWESYIAYARDNLPSKSKTIKIGTQADIIWHVVVSRFTDRHGFASARATRKLINQIKQVAPDIIQLQHLHGYYINIEILFDYLSKAGIPVVWTFHDCWSFTGHCAHYEFVGCQKWQQKCYECPQTNEYPKAYIDNSASNFASKKELFNSVPNLTIVPASHWLGGEVEKSFLNKNRIEVIQNGINLDHFQPLQSFDFRQKNQLEDKFIILGVASPWNSRKGFAYFLKLLELISPNYQIVLVGLGAAQIKSLPSEIIGIERTKNVRELAELYSMADVFLNPTLEDTFPTTNLEALACGTPVITFRSGGSPEAVDENTGIVVEKSDVKGLKYAVDEIRTKGKDFYSSNCRQRAERYFDKKSNFAKYIELYKELI